MAQRAVLLVFLAFAASSAAVRPLPAQVPPLTCSCAEDRDFGYCGVGFTGYPGTFPGSALVATTNIGGKDFTYLYVADLYDGFTYRYEGIANGVITANTAFNVFSSPLGSQPTTGVAYNSDEGYLLWAIQGKLVRTGFQLENSESLGRVDLATLRTALELPEPGVLG